MYEVAGHGHETCGKEGCEDAKLPAL